MTGGVGLGFQNVVGIAKKVVVDFAVGYQFYIVPSHYKASVVENKLVYGKFDANNGMLGPTSPLQLRIGIGYLF
jgi:hypothetical protein